MKDQFEINADSSSDDDDDHHHHHHEEDELDDEDACSIFSSESNDIHVNNGFIVLSDSVEDEERCNTSSN